MTDADLIQIVEAALADATRRAGPHLVCRPGCSQCCVGSFAINALDADRLRRGAHALALTDPERHHHMMQRVGASVTRLSAEFPGDSATGILDSTPDGQERFQDFANDEVCPVLDPDMGTCDLYDYRPMTCRVFGPPVRASLTNPESMDDGENGLGVCELCFTEASPEEIATAELIADPEDVEAVVLAQLVQSRSNPGETIVAYALSTQISADAREI